MMVEIRRFLDVHQAEFAVSVLAGSGVEAYIDQPFTGNIAPHYMVMTGGVRLFVHPDDLERAIAVLESSRALWAVDVVDSEDDS
jgi:hypothetical protein